MQMTIILSPYALLLLNFSLVPIISPATANSSTSKVNNDGYDKAKESESFCENEDQDHSDNEVLFLSVSTYGGISNNSNSEARC